MAQQRAAAAGRYVSPPLWRGCGSLCVCGRVQEPAPLWARGGSLATVPRARGRSDRPWRRRASPMGRARLRRGRLRGFEARTEPTPPCVAAEERSPRPDRARGGRSCRGASRTRQKRLPAAPPSQPDGQGAVAPRPVETQVRLQARRKPVTRSGSGLRTFGRAAPACASRARGTHASTTSLRAGRPRAACPHCG